MKRVNETEKQDRVKENLNYILDESKFRFNSTKEAWRDLETKAFVLLGFVPLFIGFIVVNDLLDVFATETATVYKLSLLCGIILVLISGLRLVGLILPEPFKTSASDRDMLNIMKKNKLFNAKGRLIQIYIQMNDDNKMRMSERADVLRGSAYLLLIGTILVLLSKAQPFMYFLMR